MIQNISLRANFIFSLYHLEQLLFEFPWMYNGIIGNRYVKRVY